MKKNVFFLMMLFASFGFTSCSNDYEFHTQSNKLSPSYEDALKSKEFASYHAAYNQYMEEMTDFVNQLTDEQKNTLVLLVEQCKGDTEQNQAVLEYYWKEISGNYHERLEELHVNTVGKLETFNKKFAHRLSHGDKESLNRTIHSSSVQNTDVINLSKTRSTEANCIEKCKKEYEDEKISLAIDALCETAVNVAICAASYGTVAVGTIYNQAAVIASYVISVQIAKMRYDDCLEAC